MESRFLLGIDIAREISEIDRIIVSTDDSEIASVASTYGAEVYDRPARFASDEALVIDALKDLLSRLASEGDATEWVVLLEPTCPLRSADDVRKCLALVAQGHFDSVATFKDADLNPHRAWRLVDGVPGGIYPGCCTLVAPPETPQGLSIERGGLYLSRRSPGRRNQITPGGQARCSTHAARTLPGY